MLAIDPGRAKCGIAVVDGDGATLYRAIVTPERLVDEVRTLVVSYAPVTLLVGAGTGSKPLQGALAAAALGVPLVPVDESYTSEAARARFVAENSPHGWQRLLPRSLRTPDRPYDDYVAIILAERWIKESDQL